MQSYSKNLYYNIFSVFLYFIKVSFPPFHPSLSCPSTLVLKKKCKKNKKKWENIWRY